MTGKATTQMELLRTLEPGHCLTSLNLRVATGIEGRKVADAIGRLVSKGLVERKQVGCFQLTKDGKSFLENGQEITSGPNGPLTGKRRPNKKSTVRQRAWNVMRMGNAFSIPDLLLAVMTPDDGDPTSNLQRYLKALVGAGYLAELPTRKRGTRLTSNGFKRYRLIRNSGEIAPSISSPDDRVSDRNLAEDASCK